MFVIFGFIAASLTTIAFLPQAIKTVKTRSTEDLSPVMYGVFFVGVVCWLVYGIMINDLPMIAANAVTALLSGVIFVVVLNNNAKRRKTDNN